MKTTSPHKCARRRSGFTILEVLVSVAILAMLMALVAMMFDSSSKLWKSAGAKTATFQSARTAIGTISRQLGQATLNSFTDYARDASGNIVSSGNSTSGNRTAHVRQSNLHFLSGPPEKFGYPEMTTALQCHSHAVFFQAPLGYSDNATLTGGLNSAVNVCGYYVEFSDDSGGRAGFISGAPNARWRYRLMEVRQPTEANGVYGSTFDYTAGTPRGYNIGWLKPGLKLIDGGQPNSAGPRRVLAENVIAMVLLPVLSLADPRYSETFLTDDYVYNSRLYLDNPNAPKASRTRNSLPPVMQLMLVAIDEPSAKRLAEKNGDIAPFGPASDMPVSGLFSDPEQLASDMAKLTKYLQDNRIGHRVFTSDILIRGTADTP
jgi:uncharacterized protein (TIGR02599 family)